MKENKRQSKTLNSVHIIIKEYRKNRWRILTPVLMPKKKRLLCILYIIISHVSAEVHHNIELLLLTITGWTLLVIVSLVKETTKLRYAWMSLIPPPPIRHKHSIKCEGNLPAPFQFRDKVPEGSLHDGDLHAHLTTYKHSQHFSLKWHSCFYWRTPTHVAQVIVSLSVSLSFPNPPSPITPTAFVAPPAPVALWRKNTPYSPFPCQCYSASDSF